MEQNLNLNLIDYARIGLEVKRFSYPVVDGLLVIKPKKGERFFLHEDYLGSYSIVFIVCIYAGAEIWRHNVANVSRITYLEGIKIPIDAMAKTRSNKPKIAQNKPKNTLSGRVVGKGAKKPLK